MAFGSCIQRCAMSFDLHPIQATQGDVVWGMLVSVSEVISWLSLSSFLVYVYPRQAPEIEYVADLDGETDVCSSVVVIYLHRRSWRASYSQCDLKPS